MTPQLRTTTNTIKLVLQNQPPPIQKKGKTTKQTINVHDSDHNQIFIANTAKKKKKNRQTSNKISQQIKKYQKEINRNMHKILQQIQKPVQYK